MSNCLKALYCVLGVLASSCFFIFIGSMRWLKTNRVNITYENINESLNGFRILQISDLHAKSERRMILDIWSAIKKEEFDIAVITGDIVNDNENQLKPHLEEIKALAKRVPVYFVDGNHDRSCYRALCKVLTDAGVIVLNNEKAIFNYHGIDIEIVGVRDYYILKERGFADINSLLDDPPTKDLGKSNDSLRIIISHQPQIFNRINSAKNTLIISGHTHGGQIRLPFLPILYAPGQKLFPKLTMGIYEKGCVKMYISVGIGATTFPIRFYNRPEIVLLETKNMR